MQPAGAGENPPKPVKVAGNQNMSRQMEMQLRPAARTFPYLTWKGSSMVTQCIFLIGLANSRPPERGNTMTIHQLCMAPLNSAAVKRTFLLDPLTVCLLFLRELPNFKPAPAASFSG